MRTLGAYYRLKRKFPTDTLLEHGVSKDGVNILLEIMNPYPAGRITATEALSRPWTCVQELATAISTHPNIEKDYFEPGTGRLFDDKPQIADWTCQVNASPSFNTDEGLTEMGKSTPASAAPSTAMNLYLTDERNGISIYVVDSKNNNHAISNSTTESWPPFAFLPIDLELSEPAKPANRVNAALTNTG